MKLALEALECTEYPQDHYDAIVALREALAEQPAPVAKPHEQEPFGYFQYDIRLDAWVQNRVNNKGVAFYTKEKK